MFRPEASSPSRNLQKTSTIFASFGNVVRLEGGRRDAPSSIDRRRAVVQLRRHI